MKPLAAAALLLTLAGCAEFKIAGTAGIQRREMMNDLQAKATRKAVCDISLGAHLRGSDLEQQAERMLCDPNRSAQLPEILLAPEPDGWER